MWTENLIFLCALFIPVLVYSQDKTPKNSFENMINTSHITNQSDMANMREAMDTINLPDTVNISTTTNIPYFIYTTHTNDTSGTSDMDTLEESEKLDVQDTSYTMKTTDILNTIEMSVTTEMTKDTLAVDMKNVTKASNLTDTKNSTDSMDTTAVTSDPIDITNTLRTKNINQTTNISYTTHLTDMANATDSREITNTADTSNTTDTTNMLDTANLEDTFYMTGTKTYTDAIDTTETTNLSDPFDTTEIINSGATFASSDTTDMTNATNTMKITDSGDILDTTDSMDTIFITQTTDVSYTTYTTDMTSTTEPTDTMDITEMTEITYSLEMTEMSEISENEKLAKGEKKLSENILAILEHFKKPDPMGVPGVDLPEPCPVADSKQAVSFDTMYFSNTVVYGINKLKILHVSADAKDMEIKAEMSVDKLDAHGYYILSSWFNPASGPYTVNSTGVKVKARANLGVEQDGNLRAQDIHIDVTVDTFVTKFENLGFVGEMFQSSMNARGPSALDSSLPSMLQEAYPKIRTEINKKIDEIAGDKQFSNSISPLDLVMMDIRNLLRHMNMDPLQLKDYITTVGIFTVALSNTEVTGMSSFQRFGNITLTMKNNTVVADFEVGTQKLEGKTQWDISALAGLISRAGSASLSIEYITTRVILELPLDTRKQPVLRDLIFDIGNIQVRSDGTGTLDYIIELAVNILPNLVRYQVMYVLEFFTKVIVQQKLDELNVDKTIKLILPKLDEMQGFQLSALRTQTTEDHQYDDDDFFNF